MRIISPWKDYYDHVQMFGFDPNICYVRNKSQIQEEDNPIRFAHTPLEIKSSYFLNQKPGSFEPGVLGFCGSLYFCFSQITWSSPLDMGSRLLNRVFFNLEDLRDYLKPRLFKPVDDMSEIVYLRKRGRWMPREERSLPEEGALILENKDELFLKYSAPVFFINLGRRTIDLNPDLSELGFQKIKSPEQTYQELMGYLTGPMLPTSSLPVEISDESQIEKKGYDLKWSFRKHREDPK